jgi:hypothetical protein
LNRSGYLACKRQDLLGTRSKIIHHLRAAAGLLTLLKVDTTTAFQHLTSKPNKSDIAMNINRACFAGNLTAEPEVNYSPKGTAVVNASIDNS